MCFGYHGYGRQAGTIIWQARSKVLYVGAKTEICVCVHATGALCSGGCQRFLWLGNICWVKRRPEVRLGLQEVPPNLKHLPILGETLCLSVWSYPHILLFSILILFLTFLFVSFSPGGVYERGHPPGRGGREKKGLSFVYATSREAEDRLSILPSCKKTQPKWNQHIFNGGTGEGVVEHFWVSSGAVDFGYAALSLVASCLSEVLLVYRVSMSDLRFTREIGSCCSQQKRREQEKRQFQVPCPATHLPVKAPGHCFPRAVSGTDVLLQITGKLFLQLQFKEFSNPKRADIPETQLPSRTPPPRQEGRLKFPFYISSFIITQSVQDQTNCL